MSDKRTQADGTLVDAELIARRDAVAHARDTLRVYGIRWSHVRTWALGEGWTLADCPERTVNPRAVEAWAAQQAPTL